MTSPNSYISGFSYRRYLAILTGVCGVGLILATSVSFLAIRLNWVGWQVAALYQYQLQKIEMNRNIDLLLVGDSSLGNAVDARQWSHKLNRKAVSLALTGVYGYAGSLNMIRRSLRRHPISAIVIVHTPDIVTRAPVAVGNLYTAETAADILTVPPRALAVAVASIANWQVISQLILDPLLRIPEPAVDLAVTDYVPQGPLLSSRKQMVNGRLDTTAIKSDNFIYLRQIADLCRAHVVNCIYMHGPLTDGICRNSGAYFTEVNTMIKNAGLQVVSTPICMPWEETGDSEDHVLPSEKEKYSLRILNLVQPMFAK